MSTAPHFDVIVIGGGPSGMMAAGRAGSRGRRVLLIEKNKSVGKKLSITGGGRCNIFNAEEDIHALLGHYGTAAKFLYSPFSQYSMQDTRTFFEKRGLPIVIEARKRAFPASQRAQDVTNTMKRYAVENRVEFLTGTKVKGFAVAEGRIVGVETTNGFYTADAYIVATGGSSHKETGSTGDGIAWLKKLGHTVHDSSPDVVPVTVSEKWVKELSGTTLSFMKITFGIDQTKKEGKFSRTGKILFTHFGLSGPLILNSAHEIKKMLVKGPVRATIDMYPDTDIRTLRNRVLELFNRNRNKMLKNILQECVPEGMQDAVSAQISVELLHTRIHSVEKDNRNKLVDLLKAMPLTITGTMGMDRAVVSDGGVDLKEIDTKTMCSKLYDNLYVTGDVLHINRPSGGFSLQLCWTTGFVAGSHA